MSSCGGCAWGGACWGGACWGCACACWDIAASVRLVAICEPIANAAILPLIIFQNAQESNIPF